MSADGSVDSLRSGELRDAVRVAFGDDTVRVTHGLWEVSLPAGWVSSHADVDAFLRRRSTRHDVTIRPEASALIALLDAQGCIIPEPLEGAVSLSALRERFDRLRGAWYATYNSHSMWDRLRQGVAGRNELLAYLVHNYHVSRVAGAVAARMATRGPAEWRAFFAQDAREEYWHCDAYYFVQSEALGCSVEQIKAYVPLPGSTAFEQHTLQLAENDPVAHLLIAYFQESSIVFREAADDFYAEVSRAYHLEGFFRPWQAHMSIDIAEQHAAGLAALFTGDVVDARVATRSLALAWAGYYFLCASLDDVLAEARPANTIILRTSDSLGEGWATGGANVELGPVAYNDLPHVIAAVCRTALLALAYGRGHDEIILAGRIHQHLTSALTPSYLPASPWTLAIGNYLAEAAVRPTEWFVLVEHLAQRLNLEIDRDELERRLAKKRASAEVGRFDELIVRWANNQVTFPGDL
jgi:hypothetical protein